VTGAANFQQYNSRKLRANMVCKLLFAYFLASDIQAIGDELKKST
jgi:hypothetical protein